VESPRIIPNADGFFKVAFPAGRTLGLTLQCKDRANCKIAAVDDGSRSERVGIRAGDYLTRVEGESIRRLMVPEIQKMIKSHARKTHFDIEFFRGADHMEIPTYDRKSDDYKITRHIKLDSRQVTEQPSPSRSKSATRKRSSTHHEGDQRMELEDNPFADATSSSPTENPFSDDFNDNPFTDEAVGQRRDPDFSRTFQDARSGSEQSNDLFSPVSRSPVSRSKPAADYNPFLD